MLAWGVSARAAEISISCSALGKEYEICKEGADALGQEVRPYGQARFYPQFGHRAPSPVPAASRRGRWRYRRVPNRCSLARHPRATFRRSDQKAQGQVGQHFPPMIQSATVDGKLVAMPWFADAGLLYYRKDLLEKYNRPVPRDLGGTR